MQVLTSSRLVMFSSSAARMSEARRRSASSDSACERDRVLAKPRASLDTLRRGEAPRAMHPCL